jgi:hypothetical protein
MKTLATKLEEAKIKYAVLISEIDVFGSEIHNEVINGLIDKCLDKIDCLERMAMPNNNINLLRA